MNPFYTPEPATRWATEHLVNRIREDVGVEQIFDVRQRELPLPDNRKDDANERA